MKRFLPLLLSLCCAVLLGALLLPSALADGTAGYGLTLLGGEELDWVCGVPFVEPGYTAVDETGCDCTDKVRISGKVRVWYAGDYELSYSFKLKSGERLSAVRTVHVRPAEELPETVPCEKTIYLTFDDGPSAFTEEVLETLAKYNIKATFFIVASRSRCEELLPRIVEEGHTLGIHCYEHNVAWLYKNWDNYFEDLMKAEETVYRITGDYAHIIRMPGGSRSAYSLMGTLRGKQAEFEQTVHEMGLRYYDWNIQPESYTKSPEDLFYLFSHPKTPYDSVIVLQHDTRQYSVRALDEMIQWALDEGYTFAPIDLTTPEVHSELY